MNERPVSQSDETPLCGSEAKRGERGRLLSEMEQVTGMHRKSLTRLMYASSLERKKRSTPRPRRYGLAVERVIVQV